MPELTGHHNLELFYSNYTFKLHVLTPATVDGGAGRLKDVGGGVGAGDVDGAAGGDISGDGRVGGDAGLLSVDAVRANGLSRRSTHLSGQVSRLLFTGGRVWGG